MITIDGRFASYGELWFDEVAPNVHDLDVLMFRLRSSQLHDHECDTFLSLVNDLTLDEDRIFTAFSNTNRYQINRADRKDGLAVEFFTAPEAQLPRFCEFYARFAQQKGLPGPYRRGLEAACRCEQLVMSCAVRNGEPIVWHAYIRQHHVVGLLHSASHFRVRHNTDPAIVGRANRWLHWRDMVQFKRLGLELFDWGGLFADESAAERAGVNRFKRQFGGTQVTRYNATVALTRKGRLYLAMRRAVDVVKNGRAA